MIIKKKYHLLSESGAYEPEEERPQAKERQKKIISGLDQGKYFIKV